MQKPDTIIEDQQNQNNTSASKRAPEEEPFLPTEKQQVILDPLSVRQREEVEWTEEIKALQDDSAIEQAGCCSRLFFSWARPFLSQAQRGQLHIKMFGRLRDRDSVQGDLERLKFHYARYVEQGKKTALFRATFRSFASSVAMQITLGFAKAVLSFASPFLILKLVAFIKDGADDPEFTWEEVKPGVIYAGILCGTQILSYFISEHMAYYNVLTGRRSSNAVIAFIYQKYSRISSATNKDFSSGQIVNFVQVDAQRLYWISYQISNVVQIPFIFLTAFAIAFYVFGVSFCAGLGVFILAIVGNFFQGRFMRRVQKKVMKSKDARMKVSTEAINNIKMIKLYSWQENFLERIYRRRSRDVEALRMGGFAVATLIFMIYFFPSLLPVTTFATYIGLGNYLEYQVAVASLVLFGLMRGPLIQAPIFFGDLIQLQVSMKRIQQFLQSDEVQTQIKDWQPEEPDMAAGDVCLSIKGCFSWGFTSNQPKKVDKKAGGKGAAAEKKDSKKSSAIVEEQEEEKRKKLSKFITLSNVDLEIQKGEFVCIIGDVGSGKSSLLQAVIGDMIYVPQSEIDEFGGLDHKGTQQEFDRLKNRIVSADFACGVKPIKVRGSVAYVEQGSWIQNKTIQDNILFNQEYDALKYSQTIKKCQLERDLEILPAGDQTEIGEKGINLSGGQKARISLARAVYADSDIIMMDDPISALDANVRKKIFKQVFQGVLKEKTRILVTHAIDFLHLSDKIIVLKDGKVQACGTFEALQTNKHLQDVLAINKKNMEESKQIQRDALSSAASPLLLSGERNGEDQNPTEENKESLLIVSQSQDFPDRQPGQRLNNSTFVRSSVMSNSTIRITTSNQDSMIEEEKVREPMLYRTQNKDLAAKKNGGDSESSDSEGEVDPSEAADKQSEAEDLALKDAAAKQAGRIIKDEQDEIVKVLWSSYARYFKFAGGWWIVIIINTIIMSFVGAQMFANYYTQKWAYASEQEQRDNFEFYVFMIYGLNIMSAVMVFVRANVQVFAGLRVGKKLHNILIAYVFRAPINLFFDVTPIGKILNRFSKDLAVIDEQIYYNFGGFMVCLWQVVICLVVSVAAVPYILVVIAVFLIFACWLFVYSMKAYKDCYRIESVTMSPILSYFQETFNGNSVIRAFGKEEFFKDQSFTLVNKTTNANQVTIGVFGWYSLRLDMLTSLILVASCAAVILLRTTANPIFLSMMLEYVLTLQSYLQYTMSNFGEIERKMVSTQRLFDLELIPQEKANQPRVEDPNWPQKGAMNFVNVYLRYRPNTEITLRNLSFEVPPGTKVGVVGRTGAGKSTMSLALSRIVELCGGKIEIDGVNISEIDINQVREKITVIAQDPTLFTGTLRFNLDPFREHSNAAIEQLLLKAGLVDLLSREPESTGGQAAEEELKNQTEISSMQPTNDLDTVKRERQEKKKKGQGIYFKISEAGANLSAGERQLICICRAILRKNKVVILDEATANIDIVTEQKIQSLIEQEFAESTVITIAHRLNTIIKSDRVLVLSHGQVLEYDSPAVLMENPESHFSGLLKELKQKKELGEED